MIHEWQCGKCKQYNLGHSTICAHCPSTDSDIVKEMVAVIKRHIDRKENGAPQHKHTYQDFKNIMQKYQALK